MVRLTLTMLLMRGMWKKSMISFYKEIGISIKWNLMLVRKGLSMCMQLIFLRVKIKRMFLFGGILLMGNSILPLFMFIFLLNTHNPLPNEFKWDSIWKLKLPNKVKYFVWLVVQERILTNKLRVSRRLMEHGVCEKV